MANYHLVILKKPYLNAILNGRKTIESRFAKTRPAAFGQVQSGDRLFLKVSSGPVCATATVAIVKYFENLTEAKILQIKQQYNEYIGGDDEYWHSKLDSKSGLLAWLKDATPIEPVRINKKDWRAWVVLSAREHFGLFDIKVDR
jgi:ASC-1-like (ASCH) protein